MLPALGLLGSRSRLLWEAGLAPLGVGLRPLPIGDAVAMSAAAAGDAGEPKVLELLDFPPSTAAGATRLEETCRRKFGVLMAALLVEVLGSLVATGRLGALDVALRLLGGGGIALLSVCRERACWK